MSFSLTSLTVLCVLCISAGQLFFKRAALAIPDGAGLAGWLLNGWLIMALLLYGMTTLLWVWILRHAPLHLAYPFMGLAFLMVPIMAALWMDEPLHWQSLAGGALILAGVWLAASGS